LYQEHETNLATKSTASLTAAALRDYCEKADIPPVGDDGRGSVDVVVWPTADPAPAWEDSGERPMIVEIRSRGHGSGGDIRCW
jgi:hypothetical protein